MLARYVHRRAHAPYRRARAPVAPRRGARWPLFHSRLVRQTVPRRQPRPGIRDPPPRRAPRPSPPPRSLWWVSGQAVSWLGSLPLPSETPAFALPRLSQCDRQSISAVRARPPPSSSALCRHPRPRCPQRCAAHSSERWCPHTSPPRPAETNRQRESGKAASLYFRLASRRRRLPPCTTMPKVTTLGHAVPGRFPRALLFAGGRGGLGGGENRARGLRPTERATRRPRHAPRN